MKNRSLILFAAAATALAVALPAQAAGNVRVTIHHQTRGCHAWAIGNGAFKATQSLTVAAGTTIAFTNNDVMSHQLVQLTGSRVTMPNAGLMGRMGAGTKVTLTKAGTYVFKTKAGEDYFKGVKTTGEDNVLELVVRVK